MAKKKAEKLSPKELEKYKALLIQKWHEIVGDVQSMEQNIFQGGGEISNMPVHMADVGSDSFEQEFGLDLVAEEKKILMEIQEALKRIETGEYGICEGLGIPIEKKRLEAIPWTRYSLEYAQMMEKQNNSRLKNYRARPLDIEREEEFEEEEEEIEPTETEEVELGEEIESLDALEEQEEQEETEEKD